MLTSGRALAGQACGRAAAAPLRPTLPVRRWGVHQQAPAPSLRPHHRSPVAANLFPFDQAWNPNVTAQVRGALSSGVSRWGCSSGIAAGNGSGSHSRHAPV
jgi:hypothetical protein